MTGRPIEIDGKGETARDTERLGLAALFLAAVAAMVYATRVSPFRGILSGAVVAVAHLAVGHGS